MNEALYTPSLTPFNLLLINIQKARDTQLLQISKEMGLALNLPEMRNVKQHYLQQKRNPTDIELQTIGQTWSEHCYHKIFKGTIMNSDGNVLVENLLKNYIAKATTSLQPSWCVSVFEDNAGIISFDNEYGIAVKVETHNHPSAIEPFGGAATGTGGVIRDVLGVWGDPIACTDVLCFGPLDYPVKALPTGIKHPRYIYRGVIAGIGHYGNNIGIPTVNGAIFFEEGYVGNPLVYCGCIGILPLRLYVKDTQPDDAILLVGGRTGRDGIHGVTFASLELTEESEESRPAVQIANPIEEEKIRRAIIRVRDQSLASGITDLGGGGLSSAVCEMAHRAKCGFQLALDQVPLKTRLIEPWEIWISESQERMLLSVRQENVQKAIEIFAEEQVEATCLGWFTHDQAANISFAGLTVARLDLHFLFNAPQRRLIAEWKPTITENPVFPQPLDLTNTLIKLLGQPNIASREAVIRTYDHEVLGNTVLKPLQGRFSGPNDAAVIKPLAQSWKGIVISCGMKPRFGLIDPYWMAAASIDEAIRNNVSVGGRRIALLDNFCWGNPEKPDRLGGLVRAAHACYDFASALKTPFISGKDSLYNESPLGPVTPSLLITAIGIIPDIRRVVSMNLKAADNHLYIIGVTRPELGGSEYYRLHNVLGNRAPIVEATAMKNQMAALTNAIDQQSIVACHDLSDGGLGVAAAEMVVAGELGMEIDLSKIPEVECRRDDTLLFSETNSRFLIEVPAQAQTQFEDCFKKCVFARIGQVTNDSHFVIHSRTEKQILDVSTNTLRSAWKGGLQ
jgi:phosphoribosylformylglycinamidine synthase